MSKHQVERRLREVGARLTKLRDELRVADEQLVHLDADADDARLRSLVSETPIADREYRASSRHAESMRTHRAQLSSDITRLENRQDELLDRLVARRDRP